jgi:uncharacterized membrane protein
MPEWILFIAFWFHMLVTVLWLGILGTGSFWVIPKIKILSDPDQQIDWMVSSSRQIITVSWIGISLLTVTGLFQMSDNANYEGLLSIGNLWSVAILSKHVVFLVMVILTGLLAGNYFSELKREQIRFKSGQDYSTEDIFQRIERVIKTNFWLGALTLAFTALARIS